MSLFAVSSQSKVDISDALLYLCICGHNKSISVLSGFIFMKWISLHLTISLRQFTISLVLNMHFLNASGCDLMLILKHFGPSTEPCGVPHGTSILSEYSLSMFTRFVRPSKKDLNHFKTVPPNPIS